MYKLFLVCLFLIRITVVSSQITDDYRIIRMPVVFHIIYSDRLHSKCSERQNTVENLSLKLVLKELNDLRNDFLLLNSDTASVLEEFKSVIGNPRVEFYLADTPVNSSNEKGILRIYSKKNKRMLFKRSEIFDHEKYLNIYIGNIPGSFSPSITPWMWPHKDAVYIDFKWVGQNYRLLTHEVGHWLGLTHLWGTGNAKGNSKSCTDGDFISDTPPQKEATETNAACIDCPPPFGMAIDKSCVLGRSSNYNNFMDYSGCRSMFSKEQVRLLRKNIILYRPLMYKKSISIN